MRDSFLSARTPNSFQMPEPIDSTFLCSTRRKTLKVVLHYWGRRGGGSEFTHALAHHLSRSDEAVDVTLSLARQNADIERFEASGFRIITLDRPSLSTLWRQMWSLPRLLSAHAHTIARLEPDAVVITMNAPFAWPFIGMLQQRGIKVFYVTHDAQPHPGDYAVLWQRITQDLLVTRADKVVALSNNVAKRIAERIPSCGDKVSVIPLETAYPTSHIDRSTSSSSGVPVRLLFYGRLLPYKGLNLLIQALEPLRSHPGWRLTIAGSGPLEADIKKAVGNWPQVHLELGWVSDERTTQLFSTHHLLLCPYVEASQSGVIAQALSWGMPSIVMPTGALPEQIAFGTAGLVAETADAEGFRECLQAAIEHPGSLVDLSRNAASLMAERQANRDWLRLIDYTKCGSKQKDISMHPESD